MMVFALLLLLSFLLCTLFAVFVCLVSECFMFTSHFSVELPFYNA
ncbi:Uncharacterised protein [Klebsiella variicola]|nr:Uncharacterised protein [Klebsiella variicola]